MLIVKILYFGDTMKKTIYFIIFICLSIIFTDTTSYAQRFERLISKDTYDSWVNPKNPNTIFVGGGGRRLYRSYDAGKTWETMLMGDFPGGAEHFNNVMGHRIDTNIILLGGLNFGTVRRSTDGGNTWSIVLEYPEGHVSLNGKAMLNDPKDPDTYYIGEYRTSTFFRSTDKGETWDSLSTIGKTVKVTDSSGTRDSLIKVWIGCIGQRHDSTNILFTGGINSEVYMSNDGGFTWNLRDVLVIPDSAQGDCEITQFVFSENDPRVGYAVITYLFAPNKPNGGLHKTTDGGYSWNLCAFPDSSFWAVSTRKYGDQDEVFVGGYTEEYYAPEHRRVPGVGMVRRSQDGGNSWFSYDKSMDWYYEQPEYRADFNHMFIHDSQNMFLVGDLGIILYSFNGGLNFNNRSYNRMDYNSIFFVNDTLGYAVGNSDTIFRTTNRGFIWIKTLANQKQNLNFVAFADSIRGLVIGDAGVILKTTNSGASWLKQNSNVTYSLRHLCFTTDSISYVVGSGGTILKSEDLGKTWRELNSGFTDTLHKVFFLNENIGFCVGEMGAVFKTTDAGEHWNPLSNPSSNQLKALFFKNEQIGYVGGKDGLFKTTDGGMTWQKQNLLVNRYINDIKYYSDEKFFALGEFRTLFKSELKDSVWNPIQNGHGARAVVWSLRYYGAPGAEKLYMSTEAGFFVLDYPSDVQYTTPTSHSTEMKLWITADKVMFLNYQKRLPELNLPLQVRVYDMLGRIVLDKKLPQNLNNEIQDSYNLHHVPAGVYVCQLLEGNYAATKVFVVK